MSLSLSVSDRLELGIEVRAKSAKFGVQNRFMSQKVSFSLP
jgi:hypothetical protein